MANSRSSSKPDLRVLPLLPKKVTRNDQDSSDVSLHDKKSVNIYRLSYEGQIAIKVVIRTKNQVAVKQTESCVTLDSKSGLSITDPNSNKQKSFNFDYAIPLEHTQPQIYDSCVYPLIDKCLQGYNGCIFAYGQTASGKTYTMQGPDALRTDKFIYSNCQDDSGIIFRTFKHITDHIASARGTIDISTGKSLEYLVKVSYLEIYNESIVDLLVGKNDSEGLKIRIDPNSRNGKDLYVQNLTEKFAFNMADFLRVLQVGSKHRTVGETNMNAVSSRSHAVMTITVDQFLVEPRTAENPDGSMDLGSLHSFPNVTVEKNMPALLEKLGRAKKRSKIHLVDLAGSERADSTGASGIRLKESSYVNQSLSALGNVISALTSPLSGSKHVPYRDSKLTYLLSDSLGGNSLTLMIACCSPNLKNYSETLSTLRFAERVKKVQNKATINMDPTLLRLAELESEVLRLKEALSKCTCENANNTIEAATPRVLVDISTSPIRFTICDLPIESVSTGTSPIVFNTRKQSLSPDKVKPVISEPLEEILTSHRVSIATSPLEFNSSGTSIIHGVSTATSPIVLNPNESSSPSIMKPKVQLVDASEQTSAEIGTSPKIVKSINFSDFSPTTSPIMTNLYEMFGSPLAKQVNNYETAVLDRKQNLEIPPRVSSMNMTQEYINEGTQTEDFDLEEWGILSLYKYCKKLLIKDASEEIK